MGLGELEITDRDFQSMNAVERMRKKFRIWRADWRGLERVEGERPREDRSWFNILSRVRWYEGDGGGEDY
jgi:hypothetical protein